MHILAAEPKPGLASLVDEAALYDALATRRIAGADLAPARERVVTPEALPSR